MVCQRRSFRVPPCSGSGSKGTWSGKAHFLQVVYSDCVFNLLIHLGAEFAASSEFPLNSLRIRADFDSAIQRSQIRRGHRERRQLHHRSCPAANPSVIRLRYPSLRRHAALRPPAQDRLGRDPETLRQHLARWRTQARVFELCERLRDPAGSLQ
jgi:hypothetical protein